MARLHRSKYSDEDRAHALFNLQLNGGNYRKTGRESGIPEATIRNWSKQADRGELPATVVTFVKAEADVFIAEAQLVRYEALKILRSKLPAARPGELNAIIGTLDDKITRAKGLPTSRVEHMQELPSPKEIRELLGGLVVQAIQMQDTRHAEIGEVIEYAEIVEPAAIAASSTP